MNIKNLLIINDESFVITQEDIDAQDQLLQKYVNVKHSSGISTCPTCVRVLKKFDNVLRYNSCYNSLIVKYDGGIFRRPCQVRQTNYLKGHNQMLIAFHGRVLKLMKEYKGKRIPGDLFRKIDREVYEQYKID